MRVHLNFIHNYVLLKRLRSHLKREKTGRRLIAIILLEHLGDIVACESVARHLRQNNPDAYIIWLVKKSYIELIASNPVVDKTVVVHCLSERLMLANSGLFDEVIDLHFADRYCSLCRRPLRKEQGTPVINLTNYFLYGSLLSAMAQSAGLPAMDEKPRVYIPQSTVEKVDALNLPPDFIAINCTSNAIEKDWPQEKWALLLEGIQKKYHMPVYEIGLTPFIKNSSSMFKSLCGQLSILESTEVIRRARLFIGIDSGPAHLANAVGTPSVILMGSYLGFSRYNPFSGSYGIGENVKIIYSEGSVSNIAVNEVLSEVDKMISAIPLYSADAV